MTETNPLDDPPHIGHNHVMSEPLPSKAFWRPLTEEEFGTFLAQKFTLDARKQFRVQIGETIDPWATAGCFLGVLLESFKDVREFAQKDLAEAIGVSKPAMSKYLNGGAHIDAEKFYAALKFLILGNIQADHSEHLDEDSKKTLELYNWFMEVGIGVTKHKKAPIPPLFDPKTFNYPSPWTYEQAQQALWLVYLRVRFLKHKLKIFFTSANRPFLPRFESNEFTPSAKALLRLAELNVNCYFISPMDQSLPRKKSEDKLFQFAFKTFPNVVFIEIDSTQQDEAQFLNAVNDYLLLVENNSRMLFAFPYLHEAFNSVYPYSIPLSSDLALSFIMWAERQVLRYTSAPRRGS